MIGLINIKKWMTLILMLGLIFLVNIPTYADNVSFQVGLSDCMEKSIVFEFEKHFSSSPRHTIGLVAGYGLEENSEGDHEYYFLTQYKYYFTKQTFTGFYVGFILGYESELDETRVQFMNIGGI